MATPSLAQVQSRCRGRLENYIEFQLARELAFEPVIEHGSPEAPELADLHPDNFALAGQFLQGLGVDFSRDAASSLSSKRSN